MERIEKVLKKRRRGKIEKIEITVFEFKELDAETQEKVIERNSQINLFDDWWDFTLYNFAEETKEKFGIEILPKEIGFDIYRNEISADKICIIDNEKFANALGLTKRQTKDFLEGEIYFHFGYRRNCGIGNSTLEFEDCRERDNEGNLELEEYEKDEGADYSEKDFGDLTHDFLYGKILNPLLSTLRKEEEYLGSKEAIVETIENNDYRFLKDGRMY